jgi:bifunctional DNA-binding transcriptional regulator/antitoxin component of YhaV-PrlF toxin-antitoxin module
MTMTYESTVEYNEDFKEYYLTIPEELLERVGWEEGDVVEWHLNKDGTILLERTDEYTEE